MPAAILLALLVAAASTRGSPLVQDFESTYPGQEFAATPDPDNNSTLADDMPSPTPDGAETVDQSPTVPDDGPWEPTASPPAPSRSTRFSLPYILEAKALPGRGGKRLEEIALGPVEISSLLHQIMTSSTILKNLSASAPPREDVFAEPANETGVDRDPGDADESNQLSIQVVSSPLQDDADNPYLHWDSDSEEQEQEMEQQLREDEGETTSPAPAPTGRSYLLLLAGNSTIAQLRQRDFAKYLKLNLAARLSLEYDDVRVNRVVLAPPRLLVNVSVVTPSDADPEEEQGAVTTDQKEEAPLHMLAETNATLLELSGEEYHVVRLLSVRSRPPAEADPEDEEEELADEEEPPPRASRRHDDVELVVYAVVGGACSVVAVASAMAAVARRARTLDVQWPWRRPKHAPAAWGGVPKHYRMADDLPPPPPPPQPKVIYSGSFAARAGGPPRGRYAGLGVGGSMMMGYAEMEAARSAAGRHRVNSPSKLHIFSCRPGSVLIPLPPPSRARVGDVRPLDVRIPEDLATMGHDNPNYRT
ncbi:uncharacterized protein LOC134541846 [Bacillus rossius redtenbacheri]|uniref:uncharacterized protein LOC134541846 n=1 Tax=Bacillus rossius redtenbacheri TaxID=93214 RepID=UPI002FDCDBAA